MKEEVYFKIDMLPVSTNRAINNSARGGYKSKEYKEWEQFVLLTVKEQVIGCNEWYGAEIIYHLPLYYKNGNIRKIDGHNFDKYAIDTVLSRVKDEDGNEIDDCRIIEHSECKCDDTKEWCEITFYCIG